MLIQGKQVNFFDLFNLVGKISFEKIVKDISFNPSSNYEDYFKNGIIFKQYESFEDAYNEIQNFLKNPITEGERRASNIFSNLSRFTDYDSFVKFLDSGSFGSMYSSSCWVNISLGLAGEVLKSIFIP